MWLLPLTVGACGPRTDTPQAQCERQAYDDPEVRRIYGGESGDFRQAGVPQEQLKMAVRQATVRCLQQKGLAPPGGVEPVQPH